MKLYTIKSIIASFLLMLFLTTTLIASSHREAPLISNDPLADNVDLYAFRSPDNPEMITLIATYVPLQLPQGGPNYYTFGENIRYEIHVDNDASIPGDEVTYRFTFKIENEDPTTFFNIRLGAQNQKATYTLERSMDGGMTFETIVQNGIVPPNNIGPRSIESAAGLNSDYSTLWGNAITNASTGEVVFAGPTDDPFFVDLGGIFDLGDAPRQNGTPTDGLACYNVSALAIQVPIQTLLKEGAPDQPENILDPNYVIGVWASASRPKMTTISNDGNPLFTGDWVQVSRLGMPLTNEAVIPVGSKDYWNSLTPYQELADTTLDEFFYNPELALYMDDDLFGGAVPAMSDLRVQTNSLGMFDFSNGADGVSALRGTDLTGTAFEVYGDLLLLPGKPRSVDLWPAFHTGVPNAIPYQLATGKAGNPLAAGKPFINNFLPNGGDMLRLNMAVPPTPRDDNRFSSLGLVQAAVLGLTTPPYNTSADLEFIPNMDGFPNGRRLEDDVTRIELQAVSGVVLAAIGLWYDDYDPANSPSPVTDDLLGVLSYTTGVEANDKAFQGSFPYLALPFSGTGDCSGEIYDGPPEAREAIANFFVSSNTTGEVGVIGIDDTKDFSLSTFDSEAMDADGIYYNSTDDVLYQLNRSENLINAYSNVKENLSNGVSPELTATSTSDFINGREIAVFGNKLVVAQDANDANNMVNKLVVYTISPDTIIYEKEHEVDFNLWGIHLEANNLYAIKDNTSDLAIIANFLDQPDGDVMATRSINIEGMVRTHGLTYVVEGDRMFLTDVGEASSATDGAVVIIDGFNRKAQDGTISSDEQTRVEGDATMLGNPVDIAYLDAFDKIFVAERANGGGRILGFDIPSSSSNIPPFYNGILNGASAIYIEVDDNGIVTPDIEIFNPGFTDDILISARMSGGNEVPAVVNDAIGVATVTFNEDYTKATLNATVSNLSSPFAGAHIHSGFPDENGNVVFDLTSDFVEGRIQSTFDVSRSDVARFINGRYYLNVHTEGFPAGELRGNLALEASMSFATFMSGDNEVPEVNTDGLGLAVMHYTDNTNILEIKVQATNLSGDITGIHLHMGEAGENGPVVENLTPFLEGNTINVKLEAGDYIDDLRNEGIYLNVHTAQNPAGEIRGNFFTMDGLAYDAQLSGGQEMPSVDNASFGLAFGFVNSTLDSINVAILADNLTDTLTGAHFHQGALGQNGPVSIGLTKFIDGNLVVNEDPLPLNPDQLSNFLSGDFYLNLHTDAYPAGELRGQVYRIARDGYAYDLCQDQEVTKPSNAGNTSGSGMLAFNRDFDELHVMSVVNELSSEFQGAHIHQGASGTDGPVVLNMTDRWNENGVFFYSTDELTSELAEMVQTGDTYVNVHTENNPAGEVRGQIVKTPDCPFTTSVLQVNDKLVNTRIYPNPVTDNFILEVNADEKDLSGLQILIRDVNGKSVMTRNLNGQKTQFNTGQLSPGVYLLTITGEGVNQTLRFSKTSMR